VIVDYRKPVAVAPESESQYLTIFCDDGAVFFRLGNEWHEAIPIPGSQRDVQSKNAAKEKEGGV
jgi:hypothetical protein